MNALFVGLGGKHFKLIKFFFFLETLTEYLKVNFLRHLGKNLSSAKLAIRMELLVLAGSVEISGM